jgi:hypothetical protein
MAIVGDGFLSRLGFFSSLPCGSLRRDEFWVVVQFAKKISQFGTRDLLVLTQWADAEEGGNEWRPPALASEVPAVATR